jgi:hypothetical protein
LRVAHATPLPFPDRRAIASTAFATLATQAANNIRLVNNYLTRLRQYSLDLGTLLGPPEDHDAILPS